jgi:CheY-like chemotaxis protein
VTALNAGEALDFLEKEKPEIILLDINMPGMDGLEAARKIKQSPDDKNIPIIFLTARNNKGMRPDKRIGLLVSHLQSTVQEYKKAALQKSVTLDLANVQDVMLSVDWKLFDAMTGFIIENAIEPCTGIREWKSSGVSVLP